MEQGIVPDFAMEALVEVVAEAFAEAFAEVAADITVEVLAEIAVEIAAEVFAEVAAEVLVVLLDWGVGNLVYHCVVVQAGSGFDVDTGAALHSTVAGR